jgi:hypothetical protein
MEKISDALPIEQGIGISHECYLAQLGNKVYSLTYAGIFRSVILWVKF